MSIGIKKFNSIQKASEYLEGLSKDSHDYIFRGHNSDNYRIQSTLYRHQKVYFDFVSYDLERIVQQFKLGLARIGKYPIEEFSKQDWLEYVRHFGAPSPCIDFTYSPYIAMFFAFNGMRADDKSKYVVVNCLNIADLAHGWTKHCCAKFIKDDWSDDIYQDFRFPYREKKQLFEKEYPPQHLQFIPFPSRINQRMITQMGALIYDTLDYEHIGIQDFERFVDNINEPSTSSPKGSNPSTPTLIRILINKNCRSDALEKLELMGIFGGQLFLSEEGVSMDIINSRHYVSRYSYLRDSQKEN